MTTTTKRQPLKASGGTRTQSLASKSGHFLLHYAEMCLAMCVGAVILSVAFLGGFLNWQQPVYFMVGLLIIALAASSLIGRRKVSGPGQILLPVEGWASFVEALERSREG